MKTKYKVLISIVTLILMADAFMVGRLVKHDVSLANTNQTWEAITKDNNNKKIKYDISLTDNKMKIVETLSNGTVGNYSGILKNNKLTEIQGTNTTANETNKASESDLKKLSDMAFDIPSAQLDTRKADDNIIKRVITAQKNLIVHPIISVEHTITKDQIKMQIDGNELTAKATDQGADSSSVSEAVKAPEVQDVLKATNATKVEVNYIKAQFLTWLVAQSEKQGEAVSEAPLLLTGRWQGSMATYYGKSVDGDIAIATIDDSFRIGTDTFKIHCIGGDALYLQYFDEDNETGYVNLVDKSTMTANIGNNINHRKPEYIYILADNGKVYFNEGGANVGYQKLLTAKQLEDAGYPSDYLDGFNDYAHIENKDATVLQLADVSVQKEYQAILKNVLGGNDD